MKRTILLFLMAPIAFYAQTNTFPSSGSVGIGTTAPNTPLHLKSGIDNILTFQTSNDSWLYTSWKDSSGTRKTWMGLNNDLTSFNITVENNTDKILFRGGNVGIGTVNPMERLDVNGDIVIQGAGGANDSPLGALKFYNRSFLSVSVLAQIQARRGVNSHQKGDLAFYVKDGNALVESMRLTANGNLGVGTVNPGNWKLAINGKIRAREIKVETGWSDFVFEKDYNLPTLEEVEQHIKEKGHLKDIPSTKEVEENGIFLGEMDAKLLQKIEELTLYIIELKKENKKQQEQIMNLINQLQNK
ncbi:hypothetical protein LS482_09565 [Sinomicrobium kalidii]|uniref:hypothetical protein n=1 Tax=Sinomicrobium kalidii TaxID=2900738 RepID=UPI001E63187A|nr:hypothetical protein [Sinomicrobium kalidii]UGU18114.1 hypothetical protein LS482_09565 [Sinomicrobium kalidii]